MNRAIISIGCVALVVIVGFIMNHGGVKQIGDEAIVLQALPSYLHMVVFMRWAFVGFAVWLGYEIWMRHKLTHEIYEVVQARVNEQKEFLEKQAIMKASKDLSVRERQLSDAKQTLDEERSKLVERESIIDAEVLKARAATHAAIAKAQTVDDIIDAYEVSKNELKFMIEVVREHHAKILRCGQRLLEWADSADKNYRQFQNKLRLDEYRVALDRQVNDRPLDTAAKIIADIENDFERVQRCLDEVTASEFDKVAELFESNGGDDDEKAA